MRNGRAVVNLIHLIEDSDDNNIVKLQELLEDMKIESKLKEEPVDEANDELLEGFIKSLEKVKVEK